MKSTPKTYYKSRVNMVWPSKNLPYFTQTFVYVKLNENLSRISCKPRCFQEWGEKLNESTKQEVPAFAHQFY